MPSDCAIGVLEAPADARERLGNRIDLGTTRVPWPVLLKTLPQPPPAPWPVVADRILTALKGATSMPWRAAQRHSAVASRLLPAPLLVPHTMMARRGRVVIA